MNVDLVTVPAPTVKDLVAATRTSYQGPLEVGEDLMSIDIGPTIKVHRFVHSDRLSGPSMFRSPPIHPKFDLVVPFRR
jgi:hypothetical protein